MNTNVARRGFWLGVRALLPLLIGVAPFGLIYGVLAINNGLSPLAAQAMSSVVFAGSAQFIFAQLVGQHSPAVVILLSVALINLRHALYSASVAPYLHALGWRWKVAGAYVLTDEAYAAAISHMQREQGRLPAHWILLGSGVALWTGWQLSTALGILLGSAFPSHWPLDFFLPLTFIAIVVPMLDSRARVAAALLAGVAAVAFGGLPFKLGLIVAALLGISGGLWIASRQKAEAA